MSDTKFDIEAPLDVCDRAGALLRAFLMHDAGEVVVMGGQCNDMPAIVFEMDGGKHLLMVHEAYRFAMSLERTMHRFPTFPWNDRVADLVMLMRSASEEAEALCSTPSTSSSSASSSAS